MFSTTVNPALSKAVSSKSAFTKSSGSKLSTRSVIPKPAPLRSPALISASLSSLTLKPASTRFVGVKAESFKFLAGTPAPFKSVAEIPAFLNSDKLISFVDETVKASPTPDNTCRIYICATIK